MSANPSAAELIARNAESAKSHQPIPYFSELNAGAAPRLTTIVLTCADPRVNAIDFLKLVPGEVLLFRNGGARVTNAIMHEIICLDAYVGHGKLCNLMIIHHTDCGASHMTTEMVQKDVSARLPEYKSEIKDWTSNSYDGLSITEAIQEDVDAIKANKMMPDSVKRGTTGYVYDIKTGLVSKVVG